MAARRALDGWSRAVGWLKVALPLIALGLLSTLFLVSDRVDPESALPYATVDVESRLREPRVTTPTYSGTTADGSALTVHANQARPAQTAGAPSTATDVTATLTTKAGKRTDLRSNAAIFDEKGALLHLSGDVQITDPSGYRLFTETLEANLAKSEYTSPTDIRGTGPLGEITADSMAMTRNPKDAESYLLVFNGRVKLVYHPK